MVSPDYVNLAESLAAVEKILPRVLYVIYVPYPYVNEYLPACIGIISSKEVGLLILVLL